MKIVVNFRCNETQSELKNCPLNSGDERSFSYLRTCVQFCQMCELQN